MPTVKKSKIIRLALRKAGIASVTTLTVADPQTILDALEDLEGMIGLWKKQGFDIGYIFSPNDPPSENEDSGIDQELYFSVGLQLARQILIDNQRDIPDELATQAHDAMIQLRAAFYKPSYLQRRNDMPAGQGNNKSAEWNRFYHQNTVEDGGGA
ncbi:TPA: head DNA stabilization protein [Enterobacter bugandensis]|nr:hypothetical protein [Kosakonia phage Kc166B]HDT4050898.1 head DNA stabilization protein [Enterobacter bugandensis]